MIEITVDSEYNRYDNYNVIVMCSGMDSLDQKLYVESVQKMEGERVSSLMCGDAHHIELIIYFIPKSLPKGKNIEISLFPPFEASVSVKSGNRQIYNKIHSINAWGGAAIRLLLNM